MVTLKPSLNTEGDFYSSLCPVYHSWHCSCAGFVHLLFRRKLDLNSHVPCFHATADTTRRKAEAVKAVYFKGLPSDNVLRKSSFTHGGQAAIAPFLPLNHLHFYNPLSLRMPTNLPHIWELIQLSCPPVFGEDSAIIALISELENGGPRAVAVLRSLNYSYTAIENIRFSFHFNWQELSV